MVYEDFKNIIKFINKHREKVDKLYQLDVNIIDFSDDLHKCIDILLNNIFTKEGKDWIDWFLYERNTDGETFQAWDENKQPICYDVKSLYEYLKTNKYF